MDKEDKPISFRVRLWGYLDFFLNDGKGIYQSPEVYDAVVNQWLGRENLAHGIADVVLKRVPAGARVLELGAGTGSLTLELARRGYRVTAVDLSEVALDVLIQKAVEQLGKSHTITVVCEDINKPVWAYVADGSFDAVVTLRVNRYIADLDLFLQKCRRALHPGGTFVFPVFALDILPWKLHAKRGIRQSTRPFFLRRLLMRLGFYVISGNEYNRTVSPQNRRVPFFYQPIVFVARKPRH